MKQVRPPRAVDAAAAAIRESVLAGEYGIGDKLPAEPVLASSLGISRLTLRAAIAQLEAEHLLKAEHGRGVRILDYHRTAGLEMLGHLVAQRGLTESGIALIASFLELRRLLAADAVALACRRCRTEQLALLRRLAELQAKEQDPTAFEQRDVEFAREVVRAAASPALELLLNTVERLRSGHPELAAAMRAQREASRPSYGWIAEAIAAGEPEETRRSVCELLEPIDEQITAALRRRIAPARADRPARRRKKSS